MTLNEIFTDIYHKNGWRSLESKSGPGSELVNTKVLRSGLTQIFSQLKIKSILDIPCGDFNWMKEVDLAGISYTGADIVGELIRENRNKFPHLQFEVLDITTDKLPKVDLVMVRDCFVHFSIDNIYKSIENLKSSGSKWLLTTSFTNWGFNIDIKNGDWRPINLFQKPFCWRGHLIINEDCQERYPIYNDKSMILFDINNLKL